jgi:hypothetical protein
LEGAVAAALPALMTRCCSKANPQMSQLADATGFDELHIGQRFLAVNFTPLLFASIGHTPCFSFAAAAVSSGGAPPGLRVKPPLP